MLDDACSSIADEELLAFYDAAWHTQSSVHLILIKILEERLRGEAERDRAGREAAATEAAELRGQLQAVQSQNRELLDKLSNRDK